MKGSFRRRNCKCEKGKKCTCGAKWEYRVDFGRDPITNKRNQKSESGFDTEGAARIACEKIVQEFEAGRRPENITLEKFINTYYESEVKHQTAASTYQYQTQWARDYVVPHLGNMRLDRIRHGDVVQFYNKLIKAGCSRGLIKNVAMVLKKTLKAAVVWEYIMKNPAAHASPPSYEAARMKVWSQEEMNRLVERSESFWLHALYVLGMTSGMRIGEMLALNWSDIDLTTGIISITKSLKHSKEKGLHTEKPKNDNAFRNITVPQITVKKLTIHREKQSSGCKTVFDKFGSYLYPQNIRRDFESDCKACEVPVIRVHDMRHTHATHLLQKYNIKVVAERLGDTELTVLQTYAHVLPTMQQDVANYLDTLF